MNEYLVLKMFVGTFWLYYVFLIFVVGNIIFMSLSFVAGSENILTTI